MKLLDRVTRILLLVAGLISLVLTLLAFVVDAPVRYGSHNLVRVASGAYLEVPATARTYFQTYGLSELLILGLGFGWVVAVAVALRSQPSRGERCRAPGMGTVFGLLDSRDRWVSDHRPVPVVRGRSARLGLRHRRAETHNL